MNSMKLTKKALISSTLALILCFGMLLGTTYAWFTDSVTSSGNKIESGTLDVDLLLWNGTEYVDIGANSDPIFGTAGLAQDSLDTLWEPGKTQVAYLAIKNNGSLALNYKVNLVITDYTKNLYEAMEYAITPNIQGGSAAPAWTDGVAVTPDVNDTQASKVELAPGITHYFALSVHMNEDAGNEYQGGSITFDIKVLATQCAYESDAFGNQYDASSTWPLSGTGSAANDNSQNVYEFPIYNQDANNHNRQKVGNAKVPAGALKDGAENVSVTIDETDVDPTVTVNSDQLAKTFDVDVTNLKDNNDQKVQVSIRIGTGYTGVQLYHKDQPIDSHYDGEYITFESTSFSPFTVVYDAEAMVIAPTDPEVPVAEVTQVTDETIEWENYGGLSPAAGNAQQLDAIYVFKAPHDSTTVTDNSYQNWICDYFVKFVPAEGSDMTTLPEGSITLGGNYGSWGWIGFDNPEVDVNTYIPLLATFLGDYAETGILNDDWTYAAVVNFVQEFKCGVGATNGTTTDLNGAKFVVELRIVNPEDHNDYISVNTVTYTFGANTSDITSYR